MARVLAQTKTHRFAKAGIMLRGSTAASSPSAILDVKPDGGIEFMVRYADAEPTIYIGGAEVVAGAPVLLKLTRTSMNQVFASYSLDGVSWNQVASSTVPFASPEVLAGLAVTSHEPAILNTALFDQVSVSGAQSTGNLLSEGDFEGYTAARRSAHRAGCRTMDFARFLRSRKRISRTAARRTAPAGRLSIWTVGSIRR